MIIKCDRAEYDLNKNDEILFNGMCYQIITRRVSGFYNGHPPRIAKAKAKKMIKEGKLVFKEKRAYNGNELDIYMIGEE